MTGEFDFMEGAWNTITDMATNFASFEGALAVCVGVGFFIALILGLAGDNLSVWSAAAGAVLGFAIFAIISNATGLYDWLKLGFEFTNVPASIFAVGVLWALIVMLYNGAVTKGRALVR